MSLVGATDYNTFILFTILRSARGERGERRGLQRREGAMNEGEIYKEGKRERFPNYRGGSDVRVRYQGMGVRGRGVRGRNIHCPRYKVLRSNDKTTIFLKKDRKVDML